MISSGRAGASERGRSPRTRRGRETRPRRAAFSFRTLGQCRGGEIVLAEGDVHEGAGGAAEGFIFAEDESEVAADLDVGESERDEGLGANVLLNVGARDEA